MKITSAWWVLVFVFALSNAFSSRGASIPTEYLIDWTPGTYTGVPGGIDQYLPGGANQRTNLIDVTAAPWNADPTGVADSKTNIQYAVNSASSGQVIYIPSGTYKLTGQISLTKDGITLRGAGASTILKYTHNGSAIFVGANSDYGWTYPNTNTWSSSVLTNGQVVIPMSDTSSFSTGKMVRLAWLNQTNVDEPTISVGNYQFRRQQMTRITAKDASSITVFPPVYSGYETNCRVNLAQQQGDFIGIEDLVLDGTDATLQYGIWMEQCYGSWMKGVRFINGKNFGMFIYDSLNCEIRRCFVDYRNNTGSNGGGVLHNNSSGSLVEDNIIYHYFPGIEVNHGSSGNVFSYNFVWDTSGVAIDSNHGPHNAYNLYEGNVSPNLQSDGYYGSSSRHTVLRNWLHGNQPGVTNSWQLSLNRFARRYQLVGNIFGTDVNSGRRSYGNPNMGNPFYTGEAQPTAGDWWADWAAYVGGTYTDGSSGFQELDLDVEFTTTNRVNYLFGTGIPAAEDIGGDTLRSSLLYGSAPDWFAGFTWPPFDPQNVSATNYTTMVITNGPGKIPAHQAWLNGGTWQSQRRATAGTVNVGTLTIGN